MPSAKVIFLQAKRLTCIYKYDNLNTEALDHKEHVAIFS